MGEANIEDVVNRLGDNRSTARREALDDLKKILQLSKGTSRVDSLGDEGFHQIIEALFRYIRVERTAYISSSKSSKSSNAGNRLRDCAIVFRLAVELGIRKVTSKTATAIIDHVIDTLPVAGEAYCQPITDVYLKILRGVLGHAPHVEHLRDRKWGSLVDFLVQGITHYALEEEAPSGTSGSSISQHSRNGRLTPLRISQSSTFRTSRNDTGRPAEDLFACLKSLTAATNAPMMSKAGSIMNLMTRFLDSTTTSGSLHQTAFSCVNQLLPTVIIQDSGLARRTVLEILAVICRLWSSKSSSLRDEMLMTLMLSRSIITALPRTNPGDEAYFSLSNLLDILSSEYTRRSERDTLQLDDISFAKATGRRVMSLEDFGVRAENMRGTFNWATICMISCFTLTMASFAQIAQAENADDTPNKRQKLSNVVDDVFRQSLSASNSVKVCALQTIPFLLENNPTLSNHSFSSILKLKNQMLDEDPAIAAWSMIAISRIVSAGSALKQEMKQQWFQIWHLASRNLSNTNVSRPAAFFLDAILRSGVFGDTDMSKLIDTALFSNGLNGPVGMSDAALSLWSTIITLRAERGQSVARHTVLRLVTWFSSHYTLTPVFDRTTSKQMSLYATSASLLKLVLLCTNARRRIYCCYHGVITSPVFISAFEQDRDIGLSHYLLGAQCQSARQGATLIYRNIQNHDDHTTRDTSNDYVVFEMLLLKLQSFKEAWIALTRERASNISADVVQILVTVIVTASVLPKLLGIEQSPLGKELIHSARQVWALFASFIEIPMDGDSAHADVAAATALAIRSREAIAADDPVLKSLSFMLPTLLVQLRRKVESHEADESEDTNMVDAGDSFTSRVSRASVDPFSPPISRRDLPFATNPSHINRDLLLQLHLCLNESEVDNVRVNGGIRHAVDYLVDLGSADLLASHLSLSNILRCHEITRIDACRLLKKVAASCIQDYEFERCEASLCLCLEAMTALAELWVTDEVDELHDVASDMYEWFIKVPLGKGLASSRVRISLATLLQKVLSLNSTYNNSLLPSSRTSLFDILRSGSNTVKYHVAGKISDIFDQFILTEHTAILGDIIESLPHDSADVDAIALRLYVLAELAAHRTTLLRPSVYHIFETAARVGSSLSHAKACMQKIFSTVGLDTPRELFHLFASQLLYTWLETENLESVPFSIFGFESLRELLAAAQDEVVGQIIMRANMELADNLAKIMETPFDDMLETSFPKVEAYSVARDISMPPSKDNASKSTESLVRKQLGRDRYCHCVSIWFPNIVAYLFISLSDEHEMVRALSKHPGFAPAATILQSIYGLSSSKIALPPGQQPLFRAKYLLNELEFLCQRIGKDPAKIWAESLIVYVCRRLLDSVVPALGPLHACSVLRKVRVLVALAGQEALQGYALEMLLEALQPYLTQIYCAEDALGLFWYLLDHGRVHLERRLCFLCGIALTTLLSLSAFLNTPKDSTTQESHHLSTISTTSSFHKWFGEYLTALSMENLAVADAASFRSLIGYARESRPPGRADNDSVEGKLLLQLLESRSQDLEVLNPATFTKTVRILCERFVLPVKPSEDILGQDAPAMHHVSVLWSLLQDASAAQEFRLWCAEALGRAHAASGAVDATLAKEHSDNLFASKSSGALIIGSLQDLLHGDNYTAASLAEKTLCQIITQIAERKSLDDYAQCIDLALCRALNWYPAPCPNNNKPRKKDLANSQNGNVDSEPVLAAEWASQFTVSLTTSDKDDPLLGALPNILSRLPSLATRIMPFIVHEYLQADYMDGQPRRQTVSHALRDVLLDSNPSMCGHKQLVLGTLLYLRSQPLRKEITIAERTNWVDLDLGTAAAAAASCSMHKSALLFLELYASQQTGQSSRSSRRSSIAKLADTSDLVRCIYHNLDDPDFFYGVQEEASLGSVMRQLNQEGDNFKNLLFQSAVLDSGIEVSDVDGHSGLLKALTSANMNGVTHAVKSYRPQGDAENSEASISTSLTALNLHQWDLPVSSAASDPASFPLQVFRTINTSPNFSEVEKKLDGAMLGLIKSIEQEQVIGSSFRDSISALATLAETKELLSSRSSDELAANWHKLKRREQWQETENFNHISLILAGREAFFSSTKKQDYLATLMRLDPVDCQLFEVECVRHSLKLARSHAALQPALNRAMYLFRLVKEANTLGIQINNVVAHEFAGVLWDQGDMTASIRMLKQLKDMPGSEKQAIPVSRPALLADMGHRVAEARLERPDDIIAKYLLPAIKELKGEVEGAEAGRVYHEFASFCDQQLQSPDGLDEFSRVERIRQQKQTEVKDLERMVQKAQGKQRDQMAAHHAKAKQWYKLDDAEYQRLKHTRETFLQQTLENYLLSLRACDSYTNDVLRFCAMWLDNSSNSAANAAVAKYLPEVASRKFVPLMNQLSSRLLDSQDDFHEQLFDLLLRICTDHPFHGMYQIFASSKSRGGKDDLALSRHAAANRLSEELRKGPASSTWVAVHNSNISFIRFALDHLPDDSKHKSGSKVQLTKIPSGQKLVQEIINLTTKIPPPTLKIPIRSDRDYRSVPVLQQFEPHFTVAGGVSAPKIITILASDGSRMKALLKGGNDDLRQDSIMEQVFEQVSDLLKDHRDTRQRQLGIRTYKVLPLTMNAGIIEFVSNTIPLHEYSLPAHQRYFPKDWKPNKCRKEIADAQSKSQSTRIQVYRTVCANFQPVLRHFFFERFLNPDDWFARRLAYARSTAAISILGHVLGLGDRHGHNILLDGTTGEVVHIDLGVAFEAGRVLPVAEVVPFRLTRDIVDGMGLSGVEGVFRRCCNFTLHALRKDQYSIMTILDVLRYDPLYSWSISPLRLQRMQEDKKQQEAEASAAGEAGAGGGGGGGDTAGGGGGAVGLTALATKKAMSNNPGEADRALMVVARKLGKSLSVEATVNELIQQAMDERNLAVLYCGWAAYA